MRAAVLERFGEPLVVREVPDPVAGGGEVLVEVLATCVLPYAAEVFGGVRRYPLEPPVIPGMGGVARVLALGPDATRLRVGDLVWCDPTVRARDDARTPDITLQGWSSRGEGGLALSRHFHDGSFAERMVVPTENVEPLGDLDPGQVVRWAGLAVPLVPYGGLLAVGLQAGETLLVSGATGNFGSAAVAVGLAMGAAKVVAVGRNATVLADLERRFGPRCRSVALTGDAEIDTAAMRDGGRRRRGRRPRPDAARGRCRRRPPRRADRPAQRSGRADGRRGHARRGRPGPALPLADAERHHRPRAVDGSADRERADDRPRPRGAARPRRRTTSPPSPSGTRTRRWPTRRRTADPSPGP